MARTSGLRRSSLWFIWFTTRVLRFAALPRLSHAGKKKNPREQGIVMLASRDTSEKSSESKRFMNPWYAEEFIELHDDTKQ